MTRFLIICFLLFFGVSCVTCALPPDVVPCSQSLPLNEYNACVLKQLKILTPQLGQGLRALNLPALDPFRLPSLHIDRNLESLKLKANLRDLRVTGALKYVIEDIRANPKDLSVSIRAVFPVLYATGDYDVQGRLLLLPLVGIGSFKGNFTNIKVHVDGTGKEVTDKNGIRRLEVDKLAIKVRIEGGRLALKPVSPQQELAADAVSTLFNSNPRLILDIASPIIDDTAIAVSKGLLTRVLSTLTKEELLP